MGIKSFIRQLTPPWALSIYHWKISWSAALIYGLPAHRLKVIGITGTKGKSSTAGMLWHILVSAGKRTALVSTAFFALGKETKLNDLKMTMPARIKLQEFLHQALKTECTHAVIETSSEGLMQWRHVGLPYSTAVFTNLAPEHLEAHGSFDAYRSAKARLFRSVSRRGGVAIINLDDKAAEYFIAQSGRKVWGYTFKNSTKPGVEKIVSAQLSKVSSLSAELLVENIKVSLPVGGEFNAYNALAAMAAALSLGIALENSAAALAHYAGTPGRLEFIQAAPFAVVVDYAHTPESLEAVYKTLKGEGKLIAVLGSCGGGRDKAKRVPLGKLAGQYADYIVVTDEDPYDENPRAIMETVAEGVKMAGKKENENYWIVEDRRQAVHKALTLAKEGDVVVITGKGAEQWMCVAGDKKITWDDRRVVREQLADLENN